MRDFNEFQFREPLQILEQVGLTNLMETPPTGERYTYQFNSW